MGGSFTKTEGNEAVHYESYASYVTSPFQKVRKSFKQANFSCIFWITFHRVNFLIVHHDEGAHYYRLDRVLLLLKLYLSVGERLGRRYSVLDLKDVMFAKGEQRLGMLCDDVRIPSIPGRCESFFGNIFTIGRW